MHNEKNVSEAVLSLCLDIPDKTKDNVKARLDIAEICDRPKLHLTQKPNGTWQKPRAPYCDDKDDKMAILKWFKQLKFPDRFAANLSKSVNLDQQKFIGLKSHDFTLSLSASCQLHYGVSSMIRNGRILQNYVFSIDNYVLKKLTQLKCANLRGRSQFCYASLRKCFHQGSLIQWNI